MQKPDSVVFTEEGKEGAPCKVPSREEMPPLQRKNCTLGSYMVKSNTGSLGKMQCSTLLTCTLGHMPPQAALGAKLLCAAGQAGTAPADVFLSN